MESWTDTSGLIIYAADANGQQVSVAHIEVNIPSTRRADHALTKTLRGLCDEFPAKQIKCSPWDMNERERGCSGLLTASTAVAVTSVKDLSDLEAYRIAGTPTS
jgi:hypothetical protein